MEIPNNIFDKYIIKSHKCEHKNCYEIYITWDSNDADYIKDFFYIDEEDFKNDPLLQYILSYISGGSRFSGSQWENYGKHVEEDKHFVWLENFLMNEGLMLYSDWGPCHSIESIKMYYYTENGVKMDVIIPRFDTLFEGKTEEEMEKFINNLYGNGYEEGE
jgi:hypothetical protein